MSRFQSCFVVWVRDNEACLSLLRWFFSSGDGARLRELTRSSTAQAGLVQGRGSCYWPRTGPRTLRSAVLRHIEAGKIVLIIPQHNGPD